MSDDDVERLYRMLSDLRDELVGYRADLNGRLRALETAEANRQGQETAASMSKAQIATWIGIAIGVGSLCTAILTQVLTQI